jgi:AcrR family transcriptional regulator
MATSREELIKEFRVTEILEATRRVIGKYGFQGATIDRVAEEAKVAKGTIYLYFPNKDELLHAAVMQGIRGMLAQASANGTDTADPLEQLKEIVRRQFSQLDSNKDFLKALLLEASLVRLENNNPLAEEARRVFKEYLDFLASVLRRAIDSGALRPIDPELGAFMLNEMIVGTLRRRLLQFTETPLEDDADAVLELFLRGVQATP